MTPAQQRYREYLRSPHWQRMRSRILARAGERCERCGRFCGVNPHPEIEACWEDDCIWCSAYIEEGERNDMEQQSLEVHHLTYERRGRERDEDLVALCWCCHEGVTEREFYLKGKS